MSKEKSLYTETYRPAAPDIAAADASGSSSSALPPPPSYTPTIFATISFHKDDYLRFINFPDTITRDLAAVIIAAWPPGIQRDEPGSSKPETHSFKLRGNPWGSDGDSSAVASRRLVRDVLAFLHARYWVIVASLGHSIRIGSKDTLIFRRESAPPPAPRPKPAWLALTLTKADLLRVDCSDPALAPTTTELLRRVVSEQGYLNNHFWNNDALEMKLRDRPWNAHGDGCVRPRLLLIRMLEALWSAGWRSYAAVMQRTEEEDEKKADSWYFIHEGV